MEIRKLKESDLAVYKNRKESFNQSPDNIKTSLEKKAKEHNEEVNNAKTKKTDKYILAVVFWRGVGAYKQNPESVRPVVTSAEQWGLGRVNGFLYALKNGKFKVSPFDQDLLPKGHPYSSRSIERSVARFNDLIKLAPLDTPWGWEAGAKERTLGDNDWETFKKAHAWHDSDNLESLSGYRLPFAQVIDGELQVVFRGVASAMGAILRDMKGQDPKQSLAGINKSEYRSIYNLLSKYYDKFGMEVPVFPKEDREDRDLGFYKDPKDIPSEIQELISSEMPESMQFKFRRYPYPDDEKTEQELKFLIDISKYRDLHREFIEKADLDLAQPFLECIEEHNLTLTKEIYDGMMKLLHESSIFILKIKYYYNRPRPYQVAKRLGYEYSAMDSESARTPSYPSGHTIQSMMLADYLGQYFYEHKSYFYEVADRISMSRIFGGYHFPSDIRYGKMIFSDYMKYKKQNRGLDSSVGEYFDDQVVTGRLQFEDLEIDLEDLIMKNRAKEEVTNFPKRGDNLKVSLRNSNWQIFPIDFAEKIRKEYPTIWEKGGNIKGNDQYRDLVPVQERGGNVTNKREDDAVRLREAWVARHFEDFRIAGVIAQIKWLAVGSRGLQYMKNLVREEMKKVDEKKKRSFCTDDFEVISQNNNELCLKSKEPLALSMYVDHLIQRNTEVEKKEDSYVIKGVASSTSVDHYGTEMSLDALKSMKEQIDKGVVILPRHETLSGGTGLAEWDEVIGRTLSSKIIRADVKANSEIGSGYVLEVSSQLYDEDSRCRNLMKRLSRGELIGQSIGGWFERVRVVESSDGSPDRIIVEDVTLDHIAITRAPANPDSYGLSLLNVRSKLNNFLGRTKMENKDLGESYKVEEEEAEKATVDNAHEHNPYSLIKEEKEEMSAHMEEEVSKDEMSKDEMSKDMEEMMKKMMKDMEEKMKDMEKMMYDEMSEEKEMSKEKEERATQGEIEELEMEVDELEEEVEVLETTHDQLKEEYEALMAKYEELKREHEEMMKAEPYMKSEKMELEEMAAHEDKMKTDEDKKLSVDEKELDTRSKLDHDSINNEISNNSNNSIGETMNKEEMKEFASLLAGEIVRSIGNSKTEVQTESPKTVEQVVNSDERIAALEAELKRTQTTLSKVMTSPIRRGRHITTTISGVGAKGAFSDLSNRSRSEGNVALPAVVEHNVDRLGTEKIAKVSSHDLRSMLSAGLNAAQQDGLLGVPTGSWE
jgi:hypothetical protein